MIRPATFARQRWYPLEEEECRVTIEKHLAQADPILNRHPGLPGEAVAGLVPHAGWYYSGTTAATVFLALARTGIPDTVLLLGSTHSPGVTSPTLWTGGDWETPLGPARLDRPLTEQIARDLTDVARDDAAHLGEHSIELQIPFVRHLFPEARMAALMVPPVPGAGRLGAELARTISGLPQKILVVATTDMTHYGPGYGFTPHGEGKSAHDWVRQVNDPRLIRLIGELRGEEVLEETRTHHNGCSAGPIHSVIRYAHGRGCRTATLVHYTTSAEVTGSEAPDSFVGYAGFVF